MNSEKYPYDLLYVEDENITRKNYVEYLEIYFQRVYQASNAEEAYRLYKSKRPSILILDINLPKQSGLELLRQIRESDHSVKAIMLTARSDVSSLMDATELKLTKEELAFYDALAENESAVEVLGDEKLRIIAIEVAEKVKNNATIDWTIRESARAKLMVLVKRTLTKYGYPPDMQKKAIDTVLKQAELLADYFTRDNEKNN